MARRRITALLPDGGKITASMMSPTFPLALSIKGVDGGVLQFDFHCRACGGCEIRTDDHPENPQAYCKACGVWLASMARIKVEMALIAQAAGFTVTEKST